MSKFIHFKPKPDIYNWLNQRATNEYRSLSSVVQQILAEKYNQEVKVDSNVSNQNITKVAL